jgi:uncharacterized protein YkwD
MTFKSLFAILFSLILTTSLFASVSTNAIRVMYLPGQEPQTQNSNSNSSYGTSDYDSNGTRIMRLPWFSQPTTTQTNNTFIYNYRSSNYPSNSCDADFALRMLDRINSFRNRNGVSSVSLDSSLSNVACDHSRWMESNDELSHYGVNGTDPFERCDNAGTSCNAENVAYHSGKDLDWMMNYFQNSPSHRDNLLNSDYSKVGLGLNGIYVTQVFAD